MTTEACETPLPELLRAVPVSHRLEIEINPTHHRMIPVGVHCHKAAAELEALTKEVEEATRSAKAWEETASRHCRNEVFYHDLIVKIGESFGVEAKTSDDGSIQQDVLALKVPELVEQLRTQNRELREIAQVLLYDSVVMPSEVQRFKDILARIKEVEG